MGDCSPAGDDYRRLLAPESMASADGAGGGGESFIPLPARRLFAFAWRDDRGDDAFYEP